MHSVTVRQEIVDRVLQRRGRYHLFDRLGPGRTALVVIDMQNTFCAPGGPAEVPASRDIVEPINRLTAELRSLRRAGDLGPACQQPGRRQERLGAVLQHHRRRRRREKTLDSLGRRQAKRLDRARHRAEPITPC